MESSTAQRLSTDKTNPLATQGARQRQTTRHDLPDLAKPGVETNKPLPAAAADEDATQHWRHDLDALRTCLTGVVVAAHVGTVVSNGGIVNLLGRRPSFLRPSPVIGLANQVVQSFMMPSFFWISGRLSAHALEQRHKPVAAFLRGRALRLGLPSVVYTVLVHPVAFLFTVPRWDEPSAVRDYFLAHWRGLDGIRGPAWYAATLLCIDFVAAELGGLTSGRRAKWPGHTLSADAYRAVSKYGWLGVAIIGFLARAIFPPNKIYTPLGSRPGLWPQYLYAYWHGYMSIRQNVPTMLGPFSGRSIEAEQSPAATSNEGAHNSRNKDGSDRDGTGQQQASTRWTLRSPRAAMIVSAFLYVLILAPGVYREAVTHTTGAAATEPSIPLSSMVSSHMQSIFFSPGWSLEVALFCAWREFCAFALVGPTLTEYFLRCFSAPAESGWLRLWTPRYSYAAYLDHSVITTWTCYAMEAALLSLLPKSLQTTLGCNWVAREAVMIAMAAAAGFVTMTGSFWTGWLLVKKVPFVGKVI